VDVGEAIVADPETRVIAFTGSTRGGRAVAMLAAQHLKRAHLELGGNSALIVLDDVDPDKAASIGSFGSFFHQGQICMATSKHLVADGIASAYTERLASHADALRVGNPAAGARLVTGGTFEGLFYRPTVLADVPTSAPAYSDEIFGPVAPIVAFGSIEEAIELASDSVYGLSLAILTHDLAKALRIADAVPSGAVHINDQTINDEMINPFGGVGHSGIGRIGGVDASFESFTEVQWVTVRSDLAEYPF
jgi:benzaldehyde dehydrogenase (NAD)